MIQTSFFPQPEKDEPIKIIQINPSGFQLRKVEELISYAHILPDTYIIYPTGGYHIFHGVPNTFPRYQLPIWPYVKRIKFSERFKNNKRLDNIRKASLRENQNSMQVNASFTGDYLTIGLFVEGHYTKNDYTKIKKNGIHSSHKAQRRQSFSMHTLVAKAWIPNPENKKLVMHINDDPTNYLIENLKWGTQRDNMKGKMRRGPDTMEQKYLNRVMKGQIKG